MASENLKFKMGTHSRNKLLISEPGVDGAHAGLEVESPQLQVRYIHDLIRFCFKIKQIGLSPGIQS